VNVGKLGAWVEEKTEKQEHGYRNRALGLFSATRGCFTERSGDHDQSGLLVVLRLNQTLDTKAARGDGDNNAKQENNNGNPQFYWHDSLPSLMNN
jgi:hypothetical protein